MSTWPEHGTGQDSGERVLLLWVTLEKGEIFMRKFVNFFFWGRDKHTKGLSYTIWGHLSLSLPTPFLFMSTQK